jgi:hypothetical protein
MNQKKLFVATPISSFATEHAYTTFRDWLLATLVMLRNEDSIAEVYCAAERVAASQIGGDPELATRKDLAALRAATHFALIYPEKVASSVLIELGYALALNQTIVIICRSKADLPFAARAFETIYEQVTITTVDGFDVAAARAMVASL